MGMDIISAMGTKQPPQVKIFYYFGTGIKDQLSQIQYGLEEEGVPFSSEEKREALSAEKLSFAAAEASVLGVGVGIDKNQTVVLHYRRLHPDFPLFTLPGEDYTPSLGRIIGSNAARLVKGNPFKPLEEMEDEEDLRQLVTRIVYQVLQGEGVKEVMG